MCHKTKIIKMENIYLDSILNWVTLALFVYTQSRGSNPGAFFLLFYNLSDLVKNKKKLATNWVIGVQIWMYVYALAQSTSIHPIIFL